MVGGRLWRAAGNGDRGQWRSPGYGGGGNGGRRHWQPPRIIARTAEKYAEAGRVLMRHN